MATTITTKHTFDTSVARSEHRQAENHLSDAMEEVTDYLSGEGAELTSDDYADLRQAVRDAQDWVDAAYLDLVKARREVFAAWHGLREGDIVTTAGGLTGRLTRYGSVAGWLDTGERDVNFDALDIASIVRIEEVQA